jgi:hypothetical protein
MSQFWRKLLTIGMMCLLVGVVAACGDATPDASTTAPTATATPVSFPNIAGAYQGTFTTNGYAGTHPIQLRIDQLGQALSGSTNESGYVSTNTGTITSSGTFIINETVLTTGTCNCTASQIQVTGNGSRQDFLVNGGQGGYPSIFDAAYLSTGYTGLLLYGTDPSGSSAVLSNFVYTPLP